MSSFDQKYAFDAELAKAKQTNGANVTPAFENRIKAELAQAKATLGESSPQYIQLQRSIVAFANIYDSQKHDLSAAFDTLHRKSIEAVASEVARLKEDAGVKSDYHESGFNLKTAARKINVKSSVDQYLGDLKFDFHNISPDERKKLESKKFSLTSKESWQET